MLQTPCKTRRHLGYYPVISEQKVKKTDMIHSCEGLDGIGIHMEKNRQQ